MKKTIPTPPTPEVKKPSQHGKYVHKPIRSIISLCVCGNKYVSTRELQVTCVMCIRNAIRPA